MSEYVVLVAFNVEADTMKEAQERLMDVLPRVKHYDNDSYLEEWWIAEDERYDRSDSESAVFVPEGLSKVDARRELVALADRRQRIIILDPEEELTGTFTFRDRDHFEGTVKRLHEVVNEK